ncbi:MAG: SPOR domain-containing protein [Bradyrhizobium sp.]|jgi:cell division septation protein DedD|nr:MAG: SPOR domain-containing protein [Bradyrhizobium sp.]
MMLALTSNHLKQALIWSCAVAALCSLLFVLYGRAPNAPKAPTGYIVQVLSRQNEADARAAFKALQSKFPSVLGSRAPLIKRADLGDKGIYYRAIVGPFDTAATASEFCTDLKSAGGQCVIQRDY